jgi:hypothetical protein
MSLAHLEVLVEEPSAEAALRLLLPKILGDIPFAIHPFQGKTALLKKLPNRLRGYKNFLPEGWKILVLVDCDDDDCCELKARLEQMAVTAGLATKTSGQNYAVVNRIVVEELEAWFFGDWPAVKAAYPRVSEAVPRRRPYRDPDAISGGTWEAFERVLKEGRYYEAGLPKIEAARAIAEHMDPDRNTSRSFAVFRDGLRHMVH